MGRLIFEFETEFETEFVASEVGDCEIVAAVRSAVCDCVWALADSSVEGDCDLLVVLFEVAVLV